MLPEQAPAHWISDGEKYALVGLELKMDETLPLQQLTPDLYVFGDTAFQVPAHWQEWLGTIRTEEVQACNLFLLAKMPSARPEVLDVENQQLQRSVWQFYMGLILASLFSPAHKPVMLTGSRRGGEVDVRQHGDLDVPIPGLICRYPTVTADDVRRAAKLAEAIGAIGGAALSGGHWRFNRTLALYREARTTSDNLERLHQYCRCIEGLIVPDIARTKNQFKSRTELFIGPRHHDLIGEAFDVRSAVEHLHEDRYLDPFNRETRLEIVRKEAVVEYVARTAIERILLTETLWPHFANTAAAKAFWALPSDERRSLWGEPVDPMRALAEFNPRFINNAELGA